MVINKSAMLLSSNCIKIGVTYGRMLDRIFPQLWFVVLWLQLFKNDMVGQFTVFPHKLNCEISGCIRLQVRNIAGGFIGLLEKCSLSLSKDHWLFGVEEIVDETVGETTVIS